jgi:ABC-type branched-subunit amino acid transport system substrate-binding protein
MMNRRRLLGQVGRHAAALGVASWITPSWAAEEGLTPRSITLGCSIALTGPVATAAQDFVKGIQAAFAQINRAGGVNGRELRLLTHDDAYTPARTLENVQRMIDGNSAFAFMSTLGTGNNALILPITEKAGIPVLGPITGASSLRKPEHKAVFHIRPSYTDEVTRMVQQLVEMGIQGIAVVYLDNPFGKEVLRDAQRALAAQNLQPIAAISLALDGKNHAEVAQQIMDAKAGAVFIGATGMGVTNLVVALREKAAGLPMIGLSVTFTDIARLGKYVNGLAMAAVFPPGLTKKYAVVRNYLAASEAVGQSVLGLGLETWVTGHVMAEGIRRAGRDITRDKLRLALASIRGLDMGEVVINFPATGPYVGMSGVKLGVFGPDGLLRT